MDIIKYNIPKDARTTNSTTIIGSSTSSGGSSESTGKLTETHLIFGQPFDGTQDVSGDITNAQNITANGDLNVIGTNTDEGTEGGNISATYDITAGGKITAGSTVTGTKFIGDVEADNVQTNTLSAVSGAITTLSGTSIDYDSAEFRNAIAEILQATDITTETLTVTKSAHFFELIIDKIKAAGGAVLLTPADGFKVDKVTAVSDGYKLYWKATDGDKSISNMWKVNDQAICQTFNAATGTSYNVSNKYYWALVTAVGTETINSVDYHYITLSSTTKDGTLNPEVGDEIAMLGYRGTDDSSRQSAIYIAAYNTIDSSLVAPLFCQYKGINDFNLSSHKYTWFAANGSTIRGSLKVESGQSVEDYVAEHSAEGTTTYVHTAWANSANGAANFTKTNTTGNYLYIGFCTNHTESDSNLTYTDYTWSRLRGTDALQYVLVPTGKKAFVTKNKTIQFSASYYIAEIYGTSYTILDRQELEDDYNFDVQYKINTANNWTSLGQQPEEDGEWHGGQTYSNYTTSHTGINIRLYDNDSQEVLATDYIPITIQASAVFEITDEIKSTVEDNSTAINDLSQDLENISVGGRNLIMNGAFKRNTDFWNNWGSPTTREIVTNNGRKWMHIVSTSNKFEGYSQNHYSDYGITIEGDKTYTISFKAYAASGTPNICVGFHWFTIANPSSIASQVWFNWQINTTANTYSKTFTVPSGINIFNVMVGDNTTTSQNFYITDVKLEKGNQVTDWTPAPEETDASFTTVTNNISTINQKADSIQSTVNSHTTTINNLTGEVESLSDDISDIEQTADSIQSTVSSLKVSSGANLFGFTKDIKFDNCIPFIQGYGVETTNQYSRIYNFGFNGLGGDFVVSFEIKAKTASVTPTFNFCGQTKYVSVNTSWKKIILKYTNVTNYIGGASDTTYNGYLYITNSGSNPTTNHLYIRNLQIERGTMPSQFGVCLEDAQSYGKEGISDGWTLSNVTTTENGYNYNGVDYNVFQTNVNPSSTSGNTYKDYVYLNSQTLKDKTAYTLSFWAKSTYNNTVIHSYLYPNIINGTISAGYYSTDSPQTEGNTTDGCTKTKLTTNWKKYYIHWYIDTSTIDTTGWTEEQIDNILVKHILPLRLVYGESYATTAKVSIAGIRFDEGYIYEGNDRNSSIIRQTANNILLQVADISLKIDNKKIVLDGNTEINGSLTLDSDDQGFTLTGSSGKTTQISPQSIGTYADFTNKSSNTLLGSTHSNSSLVEVVSGTYAGYYQGNFSGSKNLGQVAADTTLTFSNYYTNFMKPNSGTVLTATGVSSTFSILENGTVKKTFSLGASNTTIGTYKVSATSTVSVAIDVTARFDKSQWTTNSGSNSQSQILETPSANSNMSFRVVIPTNGFMLIGYDGLAVNYGNNKTAYIGSEGTYLKYGNYGLKVSESGLQKYVGNTSTNKQTGGYANDTCTSYFLSEYAPINGCVVRRIISSGNSYLQPNDEMITITATSGTINFFLGLPANNIGRKVYFKKQQDGSTVYIYGSNNTDVNNKYILPAENNYDSRTYRRTTVEDENSVFYISDGSYWIEYFCG